MGLPFEIPYFIVLSMISSWLHLIVLAVVQGITEFLPISSSAHLVLVPQVLAVADQGLVLDIAAHVGTLGAVMVYFWRDVWRLIRGGLAITVAPWMVPQTPLRLNRSHATMVILATIPAVIVGAFSYHIIEAYARNLWIIAVASIGFGLLLAWADRRPVMDIFDPETKALTWRQTIVIGLAQCLAFIPGTSRSGITMTAARGLGLDRAGAARFSMWLSIPLILAALAKALWEQAQADALADVLSSGFVTVMVLSFVMGMLAIAGLMKWLQTRSFMPFVVYRVILGLTLIYISV